MDDAQFGSVVVVAVMLLIVLGVVISSKPETPPCPCEGCVTQIFETATCVFCPGKHACCTVRGEKL